MQSENKTEDKEGGQTSTTTKVTAEITIPTASQQSTKSEEIKDQPKITELLQGIPSLPSSFASQVAFDAISNQYLASHDDQRGQIIFFDGEGRKVEALDLNPVFMSFNDSNGASEGGSEEEDQSKGKTILAAGDSMSILRFVRGNKSKRLEISPSGLTLKYHKAQGQSKGDKKENQGDVEELVLTNMAFSVGLHLWEIIAPISCNSMYVGVYNPVTKSEILASFKTTTPRTITCCLDLNENTLKFWLNDRRNPAKNLKLTEGGPWIPCVKISTEKNKLILNPYAREPSDYYEKDFDKKFTLRKFIMPYLHNMVCVTKLPRTQSSAKASQQLKDRFKISAPDIAAILMPFNKEDSASIEASPTNGSSKDSFCFLQFHFLDTMVDFIQKHASSEDLKVYQPFQIADWFEKASTDDIPEDAREAFKVINNHITIPKSSQEESITALKQAFETLLTKQKEDHMRIDAKNFHKIEIIPAQFNDKVIVKQGDQISLVSRNDTTKEFDLDTASLSEPPHTLSSNVTLKLQSKLLNHLFGKINWSAVFRENNEMINGLVKTFYESLECSSKLIRSSNEKTTIVFNVPLNCAKHFTDIIIQHMKSHLDRLKRMYQNYQTIVPFVTSIGANKIKEEQVLETLKAENIPFFEDPNYSVDDIYLTLHILHDLSEQIWAQAKSKECSQSVKNFVNSVSRPFSAFSRLGSFITWGSTRGETTEMDLANSGFFFRESMTVSQFENAAVEISDLSKEALEDQDYLREQLGSGNRMLQALPTENLPLWKTLNYFAPKSFKSGGGILDVISSTNSEFFIVGHPNGQFEILSSSLILPDVKKFSMFDTSDKALKLKKHKKVMEKVMQRIQSFDEYKKQTTKKGTMLSIFEGKPASVVQSTVHIKQEIKNSIHKGSKKAAAPKKQNATTAKTTKSKKEKKEKDSSKSAATHDYAEEVEGDGLLELFGEVPKDKSEKQKRSSSINTQLKPFLVNESRVLGFILLSKPATMNAIDPLTIGCVFYNAKANAFYLRVKKLCFTVQYLHNFITLDPVSGHKINKISGKQLVNVDDIHAMNAEILTHQTTVSDLYSVFMRTQVVKKDWPKKDHKFSFFDDISDAEFEITNCKHVIDFTRCSYSVDKQNRIHMIIENNEQKMMLLQFNINEEGQTPIEKTQIMPFSIDLENKKVLEQKPIRIFQYENKVVILGQDYYQIIDQESFNEESLEKLSKPFESLSCSATIINHTSSQNLFNRQNIKHYLSSCPSQEWQLVIKSSTDQIYSFNLNKAIKDEVVLEMKEKTFSSEIDIVNAPITDIIQIGNLLESQSEGIIGVSNKDSILTSNGIDPSNGASLFNQWHLLNNKQDQKNYSFECDFQQTDKEVHLKQIDIELSFTREVLKEYDVSMKQSSEPLARDLLIDESIPPQRLSLIVELSSGAQINDQMHPNILICPDANVFCSNYPQPEFIFRLQNNQMFMPTSFVVKSKENRIFNGIPISQGLIFVSDNLEDLMNTRQFSKLPDKELRKWFEQRFNPHNKPIPLLSSEPVVYFDMHDQTELVINVESVIAKPVKFVKFVPTAFRKLPINFSSKPFHSNQAECQFFGVNGYELQQTRNKYFEEDNVAKNLKHDIQVNMPVEIRGITKQNEEVEIGSIPSLKLSAIRGAKAHSLSIPLTSINSLKVKNLIAVARSHIGIKEDHSDCINKIKILIPSRTLDNEWLLSGVTIAVKSYTDSSAIFTSQSLQQNKPRLRHYLLDITQFPNLLGKLLAMAQDSNQKDEMRVAALQCILNFLKNNSQDKNYTQFIKLFKEHTDVKGILGDGFLDQSLKYQQIAQSYLEKIGLQKAYLEFIQEDFLLKQITQFFDRTRSVYKVKSILDLVNSFSAEKRLEIHSQLLSLMFNKLCEQELPKYQTQEYIFLRSKLGINAFPFDEIQIQNEQMQQKDQDKQGISSLLDSRFEIVKIHNLYQFKVDFKSCCVVDQIKLYFDIDDKSSYKVLVRIIVPGIAGEEQIIYRRIFDENQYSQVCEKSFSKEVITYYNQPSSEALANEKFTKAALAEKVKKNFIQIELPKGFTSRFMKMQVELTDTYKSVHKSQTVPGIFIRPEFFGYQTNGNKCENTKTEEDRFSVAEPIQKNFIFKRVFNDLKYSFYYLPEEPLSHGNKGCLITVKHSQDDEKPIGEEESQKEPTQLSPALSAPTQTLEVISKSLSEEIKEREVLDKERDGLKKLLAQPKIGGHSKKSIRTKAVNIMKLASSLPIQKDQQGLSLKYLLSLADAIASNILPSLKADAGKILHGIDINAFFKVLFKRFILYEPQNAHPNIEQLQKALLTQMKGSTKLLCELIGEYLFKQTKATEISTLQYNQKNVLDFIKKHDGLSFNDMIEEFYNLFKIEQTKGDAKVIENEKEVGDLHKCLEKGNTDCNEHQIITMLTIIEDMKEQAKTNVTEELHLDAMIRLFGSLASSICSSQKNQENITLRYIVQIIHVYLKDTALPQYQKSVENIALNSMHDLGRLILLSFQMNDKELDKLVKDIITILSKHDSSRNIFSFANASLQWFKNKAHIAETRYYKDLDNEENGKGTGIFYKHMTQFFEITLELLQKEQSKDADNLYIQQTYQELGNVIYDLLEVLVKEQDSKNYEQNFFEVWRQVYKTIGYLAKRGLIKRDLVDLFVSKFFQLSTILQESIYPQLHDILVEQHDVNDPQFIVSMLASFLNAGFKTNFDSMKVAYCYCDGLLNIFQTGAKDTQNQTTIATKFKDVNQVLEMTQILEKYLNTYLNHSVFTGVTGANVEIVMKLDIAIQIASVLQNAFIATSKDGEQAQNAFVKLVQTADIDASTKQQIFQGLIEWIIVNYCGTKSKSSPAGVRIFNLSSGIEQLLGKICESEDCVSICLPILMKIVLATDFKLRDLIQKNESSHQLKAQSDNHNINYERAVTIQKTINTLFLTFFKEWVKSDTVAKKFLTELNGFDFLLDRLFSKSSNASPEQLAKEEQKEQVPAKEAKDANADNDTLGINEFSLFGEDDFAGFYDGNDADIASDEDPIMSIAKKKIQDYKNEINQQVGGKGYKKDPFKKQPGKKLTAAQRKQHELTFKGQKGKEKGGEVKEGEDAIKEVESKLVIDDWAKSLKIIWSSDKQTGVKSHYSNTQWHKFKNGTKNRLYNYQITDPTHQYDYVMRFDLENVIQMNEVQIGVVYNWSTYDPDCNYEPLSMILEGGMTEEEVSWRVMLRPVQDDGFRMNSITVYGHNFADGSKILSNSLEHYLEQIGCREAQFLTFRFRKPLLACMDQSLYVSQVSKSKAYGLSFISVMGTQIPQPSQVFSYVMDLQKENSLEVLSKFFSNEFTEAFELISEQASIIEKIKSAFDRLAQLMNTKAALIKPIFLAICSKNHSLGDWIMDNRLISMDPTFIKKEQISFLGDIISSCKDTQLIKVMKLKQFIFDQINKAATKKCEFTADQQNLLRRYIKLFNNKLREFAFYRQSLLSPQKLQEEMELSFTSLDLDNVVAMMSESNDASKSKFFNALTEFALILLIPPAPLKNNTIEVNVYVEKVLQDTSNQIQNLLFCSIMAATNEHAIENIIKLGKVEWVIGNIKAMVEQKGGSDSTLYQYAQILFNCSKQKMFREKYIETLPITLYNIVKEQDVEAPLLLRSGLADNTISLFVNTIRDVILEGEAQLEEFSVLLKKDINLASDKGDVDFINKVIVPILHAEERVPITISLVDAESLKKANATLQPIFANADSNQGARDNFFLRTSILNGKQKKTFARMFKELTQDKVESFQKMQESKWDLIFEDKAHQNQNPAKFKQFVRAVNNKSNVIIFVQCKILDQQVVFGGFTNKPFPQMGETWAHEFDYQIPYSEANFVCYYTPEKELHYTMTHNKAFGYIYTDYEEGGALSVSGDFFLISWSYEFQNSCGNIYDMKCVEDQSSMSFYNNMEIQHIEVWSCDMGAKSSITEGKVKSELKRHPLYASISPYNFFRQNIVFEVSKKMTLSHVAKEILGGGSSSTDSGKPGSGSQVFINYPEKDAMDMNVSIEEILKERKGQSGDSILDLVVRIEKPVVKQEDSISQTPQIQPATKAQQPKQFNPKSSSGLFTQSELLTPSKVTQKEDEKSQQTKEKEEQIPSFKKDQPLLKKFEEKGGIFDLIKAAKAAVKLYKTGKLRDMWSLWLSEIESFSQLPEFFQTFCQDHEKEAIIYNLIEGQYDFKQETTDQNAPDLQRFVNTQEELHIEMVKYSYKIVSQVFETHESAQLRDECLKNGTFERFIERIGQLSSEKKRTKVDSSAKKASEEEVEETTTGKKSDKDDGKKSKQMKTKKNKEDKAKKRKGVGYTTGVGTTWNVSEYLKSKEAKSSQAANIVNILKHMIKSKDWEAPPEIKNMLLESALLPTLEAALRSGSLLEMAKEYELNMAYLGFLQEIANHPSLIDLVLDIGDEYVPRQKEPVFQLLHKLNDLSSIFLSCLTEESKQSLDEEQIKPRNLAEKISETNKTVQLQVSHLNSAKQQQSISDIMSLPLSEAYWKLLSSQRFDYMSMKNSGGSYNHVYSGEFHKGANPPVSKLVRLAQEIADLSNSLPCDYTNAIFCRVDKERVDVMKCLIMGASGTPYAHGAFLYDLFFENSYPNSPPKCQLVTTGGQTVRFNPNLYNNGKVCLSLLGTWRGQSTENWDPKLSTILQVLLSIQAIIMSNEVYFNEPGYEHEAGTVEGERRNEGYANIVRYCNVKFAIIDAIKNPPLGFEKIIRSNFYLKKNEVLKEVKEWVEKAKTSDATYTGLVNDHNYHWAPQLSPEGKYAEMMSALYKELKETLDSLPSPFEDTETGQVIERKFSKQDDDIETQKVQGGTVAKIEDIDVSYEPISEQQIKAGGTINIEDDKVKDRWSRYIGAMGIEAVAKQAESRILIFGLGPIGVEIAKNIILAGCKELILVDDLFPTSEDLGGQFFLSEEDINSGQYEKTRAHFTKEKLQQLNFYVKVTVLEAETNLADYISQQSDLKVVVLTDYYKQSLYEINDKCHEKQIAFIYANQNGLFGQVFNDFGDFLVLDKDGEVLPEVMIQDISHDEKLNSTVVTLLPGFKHKFEDGDHIQIREVIGMQLLDHQTAEDQISTEAPPTINDIKDITIKVINPSSFTIDVDARKYSKYEGNGIAKQIKVPKKLNFLSLSNCELLEQQGEEVSFDQNMLISDFDKLETKQLSHYLYKAYFTVISNEDDPTVDSPIDLAKYLITNVKDMLPKDSSLKDSKKLAQLAYVFALTKYQSFPPLSAFLGGVVSQEIVKAITQKYTPIHQYFYYDCAELYHTTDIEALDDQEKKELAEETNEDGNERYIGIKQCLGDDLFESIKDCKLFLIGAGAIGCELLKNYAMLGIGTGKKGMITVTDPDVIEVSNLNRQFLFREKHLRKPKSQTAAASVIQMNPELKHHIQARLDKIHDGTAHIYNEEFFKQLTIVTNGLDNVQARLYIDNKCVAARTPLIDSGTLGPKGHVQIVLPEYKTESYASQRDPDDNAGDIPHCTLKMFPEETLHCVEWAKDLFGNLFTLQPQSYNKLIIEEREHAINFADQQAKATVKKVMKIVEKRPQTFDDCIRLARLRFQKHFVNDILQLLHVYPLDKVTKEGRPFWSLPKRPPHIVEFDPENDTHSSMVAAYACLLAKQFNISIPYEKPRSKESKKEIAKFAAKIEVPPFISNDQKASQIESQVDKQGKDEESKDEQETQVMTKSSDDISAIIAKFDKLITPLRKNTNHQPLSVEEFEKDNDDNFHVDFIHAMANVRAANYKLDEMDWITVKIKAGRIVPALATTTAAIAALQTIELIKYLKGCKLEEHRNSFLNLAVPSLMQSEPGPAEKKKLGSGQDALEVTLWDRWEYEAKSRDLTMLAIVEHLESTYKLSVRDIFYGSIPLYMHALQINKDRKIALEKPPLIDLTHPSMTAEQRKQVKFIDITVTFVDPNATHVDEQTGIPTEKMLEGVPPVRVILPS